MSVRHTGAPVFEIEGDPGSIRGRVAVMRDRAGQVLWSGVIVLCPSGWVMR